MIARDVRKELFEILGFIEATDVFRKITDAMRALQMNSGSDVGDLILIQSWEDELDVKDKKALLFMVRAQELYHTQFFDEAQKYESLAIKYYLAEESS